MGYLQIFIAVFFINIHGFSQTVYRSVDRINDNYIICSKYHYDRIPDDTIYFSNLKVFNRAPDHILQFFRDSSVNPVISLVENGCLIISNRDNETNKDILNAEDKARNAELGYWAKSNQTKEKVWSLIGLLLSAGVIAFLFRMIYIYFFRNQRVNLIYTGLPAVGKTGLHERLTSEPNENDILASIPTMKIEEVALKSFPIGKHEIFPVFKDIPGSKHDLMWNEIYKIPKINIPLINTIINLLTRAPKNVIICVFAPCVESGYSERDGSYSRDQIPSAFNTRFISEQLGYIKALLAGLSSTEMSISKPKIIIGFFNKVDLFSKETSDTSVSNSAYQLFSKEFADHIDFLKKIGKKAGIPCEIIFGSTVRDWQLQKIKIIMEKKLYK